MLYPTVSSLPSIFLLLSCSSSSARASAGRAPEEQPASEASAIHVNDKMKSLAQNFFKAPAKVDSDAEKVYLKNSGSPRGTSDSAVQKMADLQKSLDSLENLSISSPSLSRFNLSLC